VEKEFYSVREVAKILNLSADRIYEYVRSGYINATRITGKSSWRIHRAELERLIKSKSSRFDTTTRQVELTIEFDPKRRDNLSFVQYFDGSIRKFAMVTVRNNGNAIVHNCRGRLMIVSPVKVLNKYPKDFKIHWADTPYTLETDAAEPVDIPAGDTRRLDVVFTLPPVRLKGKENLATVRRTDETMPPVDAGTAAATRISSDTVMGSGLQYAISVPGAQVMPGEIPKLTADLGLGGRSAIGDSTPFLGFGEVPTEGCFVAIQIALSRPSIAKQAHLPPGEYVVRIAVYSDNGEGYSKDFLVISPRHWADLEMRNC